MKDFSKYTKVSIERGGKRAQEYALLQQVDKDSYFAVKTNGGERPRRVYLIYFEDKEWHDE